tara:strand:- start:872 stop:3046 length:2175 start_codon:yes stop_codon:yes gene_type:complete
MSDKTLQETIAALEEANLENLVDSLNSAADEVAQIKNATADFVTQMREGKQTAEAMKQVIKDMGTDFVDQNDSAQVQVQIYKLLGNQLKANNTISAEKKKLLLEQIEANENIIAQTNTQVSGQQQLRTALTKNVQQTKLFDTAIRSTGKSFSNAINQGDLLTSTLARGVDVLTDKTANFAGQYEKDVMDKFPQLAGFLGAGVAQNDKLAGAMMSLANTVKSLYMEFSNLTTGFVEFTGQVIKGDAAVSNFTGRVIKLQRRNRMLGVTVKDVTEAYTGLTKASRTYGMLLGTNAKRNIAAADQLTEMALTFKKVGLGTEGFGKAVDVLGKTYRRSDILKQSKLLGAEFVNIARVTGQSADMVSKNFDSAMKNLAAYSLPKAKDEFKKLSIIAATTGVEMSKVMDVASRFDDIEKAANAVGELNAMMGGPYLNTLDMVNASESERIEMLKDMMTQSGESFAEMDRFKKKAIAQSVGMDVQAAARMFGAQQGEIDSATQAVDKNGASYERLGMAASASAVSIQDQMEATKQSTFLLNKAYTESRKLINLVNRQVTKLGDTFRRDIGGIAVGSLQAMHKEINKVFTALESGDKKGALEQFAKIAGAFAIAGKEGVVSGVIAKTAAEQSTGQAPNPLDPTPTPVEATTETPAAGPQITPAQPQMTQANQNMTDIFMGMDTIPSPYAQGPQLQEVANAVSVAVADAIKNQPAPNVYLNNDLVSMHVTSLA